MRSIACSLAEPDMEMYGIHHGGNFGNNFCGEAHKLICRNPLVGNESFCFRLEIVATSTSIVAPHIGLCDTHVGKHHNIFWGTEVHMQNDGIRINENAQSPSGQKSDPETAAKKNLPH